MQKSVVDSTARNVASITDGCNPELVKGAEFDGIFEIPIIKKPQHIIVPENLVPFSSMKKADPKTHAVCEYENDRNFIGILQNPDFYIEILKKYKGFISPDCSVYRDMPLAMQITNIYRGRAIGYYLQKHGVYVIPNIRWGDERTYSKKYLPEQVAFLGVEKHSIVSIGSYGQLRDKVNRYYFMAGLDAMMEVLEPDTVLVYGKMPADIAGKYPGTHFAEYEDWTGKMRENTDGSRTK